MNPLMIAGIAQGLIGFGKTVTAKRPKYDIPAEDQEALAIARSEAADKQLPGQSGLEDAISLSSANALNASAMSGGQNVAGVLAAENKANRDLGIAAAEHQQRDVANLQSALAAMSAKKDLQFQMNEFAPYAMKHQEGRDMMGASLENINNAYMYDKLLGGNTPGVNVSSVPNVPSTSSVSDTSVNSKYNTSNINWDLLRTIGLIR